MHKPHVKNPFRYSTPLSLIRIMASSARSALWRTQAWIGGRWRAALSENTYPVYNPSSGELLAHVPDMRREDVQVAVQDAYTTQRSWAASPAKERASILRKWFDLMIKNEDELARIVSHEAGKPLQEAVTEVRYGASYIEWFSEEAKRVVGNVIPAPVKGRRLVVIKQPVGVAALITPWNFPIAMVTRKVGPALAAGCSTILKPSEETPLSALALAELSQQAGVPPGIFNVITASRQSTPAVVEALTSNELVTKLSFTGSTAVGKMLMAQCANTVKKVSLEMGGNAPLIVFDSADLKVAVQGTIAAKARNTGQTCIAPNRILVQSGIYDDYISALSTAMSNLKQGDPFQEGVNQGCMINSTALEKVETHVADAKSKGAKVVVGGSRNESLGGLFFSPTVLSETTTEMLVSQEETFGPIASVMRFKDEEEAIAIANATRYGLAAYFFSSDPGQIWRVGEAIEAGVVGINEGAISSEMVPFGGVKESGLGREGSQYGIDDYLELKYMCMGNIVERM